MNLKIVTTLAIALLLSACAKDEPPVADQGAGATAGVTTDETSADQPAPGSDEEFQLIVGDRVFFEYDRYDITPDAEETLQRQAAWLQQYPVRTVVIEGHCDERGTREYNLALGERRASAVRNYLIALGVDPNRIDTVSYGKERPYADGHDEIAWSQNRRGVTSLNPT